MMIVVAFVGPLTSAESSWILLYSCVCGYPHSTRCDYFPHWRWYDSAVSTFSVFRSSSKSSHFTNRVISFFLSLSLRGNCRSSNQPTQQCLQKFHHSELFKTTSSFALFFPKNAAIFNSFFPPFVCEVWVRCASYYVSTSNVSSPGVGLKTDGRCERSFR